jgi:hypothetical protein
MANGVLYDLTLNLVSAVEASPSQQPTPSRFQKGQATKSRGRRARSPAGHQTLLYKDPSEEACLRASTLELYLELS